MSDAVVRGGGWVVAQFALMAVIVAAVVLGPRWPEGAQTWFVAVGVALILAGGAFAVWAARTLGRSLTPFPKPADVGSLVERGPFCIVRHPIYTGGMMLFVGLSLAAGPVPLALTGALAILWALKAGVEERHLQVRYPAYAGYAKRVRWRLVPRIY